MKQKESRIITHQLQSTDDNLPYTLQQMADYSRTIPATLIEMRTIGMHFTVIFDERALRFVSEISR